MKKQREFDIESMSSEMRIPLIRIKEQLGILVRDYYFNDISTAREAESIYYRCPDYSMRREVALIVWIELSVKFSEIVRAYNICSGDLNGQFAGKKRIELTTTVEGIKVFFFELKKKHDTLNPYSPFSFLKESKLGYLCLEKWIELSSTIGDIKEAQEQAHYFGVKLQGVYEKWLELCSTFDETEELSQYTEDYKEIGGATALKMSELSTTIGQIENAFFLADDTKTKQYIFKKWIEMTKTKEEAINVYQKTDVSYPELKKLSMAKLATFFGYTE